MVGFAFATVLEISLAGTLMFSHSHAPTLLFGVTPRTGTRKCKVDASENQTERNVRLKVSSYNQI